MMSIRIPSSLSIRAAAICTAGAIFLTACSGTQTSSGRCAFVDLDHLARPRDFAGRTIICDPKRVSPAFRDQYFPGYTWGDETWTAKR